MTRPPGEGRAPACLESSRAQTLCRRRLGVKGAEMLTMNRVRLSRVAKGNVAGDGC